MIAQSKDVNMHKIIGIYTNTSWRTHGSQGIPSQPDTVQH